MVLIGRTDGPTTQKKGLAAPRNTQYVFIDSFNADVLTLHRHEFFANERCFELRITFNEFRRAFSLPGRVKRVGSASSGEKESHHRLCSAGFGGYSQIHQLVVNSTVQEFRCQQNLWPAKLMFRIACKTAFSLNACAYFM
jgi:hypothetical protein